MAVSYLGGEFTTGDTLSLPSGGVPNDIPAGSLVVVGISWIDVGVVTVVSVDCHSNLFTVQQQPHATGGGALAWSITTNAIQSGDSIDVGFSAATPDVTGNAITIDGPFVAFDQSAKANGNGTALSSGATAAIAQGAEYLVGVMSHIGSLAATAPFAFGGSFTFDGEDENIIRPNSVHIGHRLVSSIAAYTASATITGAARNWSALVATFTLPGAVLAGSYAGVSAVAGTRLTENHALAGQSVANSAWGRPPIWGLETWGQFVWGAGTNAQLSLAQPLAGAYGGVSLWSGDLTPHGTGAAADLAGSYAATSAYAASRIAIAFTLAGSYAGASAYAGSSLRLTAFALAGSYGVSSAWSADLTPGATPIPVPRNVTGAVEYVVELFNSGATFGPNQKIAEVWDARNVGWSRYDRLPGKGFFTLSQTSAILPFIVPLTTHVAIWRCTPTADTLVYRGVAYDVDSTGDDVIVECFDYLSLLSISRAGFKTLYPTKALGSEIVTPEWAAARSAASSPLGFVLTGAIEDPLGTDGVTVIKTNAQFGTLDQMRLQLLYDLSEMGRANTINQTTFEIDLTNTFNFWKNRGSASGIGFVLNGNVTDYHYLPNWKRYRNNVATLGVASTGGPSEIVSTNAGEITAKGLRQDVTTLKTLAGIVGLTTNADQQKAALDHELRRLYQQESTLALALVRGSFDPGATLINNTHPVEIGNGSDSITDTRRLVGLRGFYRETGEDISAIVAVVAS